MVMDFPALPATPIAIPAGLAEGLGKTPREVLKSRDLLCIFDTEDEVRALQPRMDLLVRQDALGIIASAPGQSADIVSRFFAPKAGIPEDPVTGSAHCTLVPYWSKKLGKKELLANQVSYRGAANSTVPIGVIGYCWPVTRSPIWRERFVWGNQKRLN
jgi:predicted PhzF superfamily epimerase YddE/YHI9